jgi:signal transduction histidine kinase
MSAQTRGTDVGVIGSPRPAVLIAIALAGVLAVACSFALALTSDHIGGEAGLQAALYNWMTLPFVLGGVVAWWRRPEGRFGPLMVATGFSLFVSNLQWASATLPFTVGFAFDLLPVALILHVFLAYPSGRLRGRVERGVIAMAYIAAGGLQVAKMLLGAGGPANALAITTNDVAAATVQDVQLATVSALCVGVVFLLGVRRGRSGRPRRRWSGLLVDSFAVALVMLGLLFLAALLEWPAFETIRRVAFVTIGLAPIAFLSGLLSARLARADLGDLLVELHSDPAPADLRDALARALRDPSLTLAYWLPEFKRWTDSDGRPMRLPDRGSEQAVTLIERDGVPVAALLHHPALSDEPELLDAVSAGAGIALENGRLQAELKARLDELRGSRGRVIEAGQKERQRLERNLHDGAQQRLIALSLELGRLEGRMNGNADARAGRDQARREIATSLNELRDVARGIHPAVVSGHGLAVALESLAAGAAVPVRLETELEGRLPEQLEVAAYYVVSESLANVAKHAQAGSATVDVVRSNGSLIVEIVDDGIGGADTERGTGLRGLADRVEALGGRLRVWTPHGGGTRVRAELPCG